jgi:hypothetical protein
MAGPVVNYSVVPVGGVINLEMPGWLPPASGQGVVTISRAVSGAGGLSAFTTLYTGAATGAFLWVDAGDLLPAPLFPGSGYVYQVTDNSGTNQVGPIYPAPTYFNSPDRLTQLFIRLLQAGVNNLSLPSGIGATQVLAQMPQGGFQALPYILVNLDLIQQYQTGIGQDVENPDNTGDWMIVVNSKRVWRVSVMSRNANERDFYRDSLLGMFQVLLATVFLPMGIEVHHDFQAASGTDAREWEGKNPGFYYAEMIFTISGTFPVNILETPHYIEAITVTATMPDLVTEEIEIPPTI